jgi:phage-related protein
MSNYVLNSIDFLAQGKTKIVKNSAFAPDGNKQASLISSVKDQECYFLAKTKVNLINGLYYCKSIFIKPNKNNSNIIFYGVGDSNKSLKNFLIFNAITKQFTAAGIFESDYTKYGYIDEYENGWIRVYVVTFQRPGYFVSPESYYIGSYKKSNLPHSFWVWGAQFEQVDNINSLPGDYEAVGVKDKSIFYNRDSNITVSPEIEALTFNPVYGSKVSFTSNLHQYETNNGYNNIIPLSINSLKAKFDLRFDLNELESQQLVNFIENKNGVYSFEFKDPSNIYRPIDGFCTEYAINRINKNHYEVAVSIEVDQSPNLFNWRDGNFIYQESERWKKNLEYQKYDILYYESSDDSTNLLLYSENFYSERWRVYNADIIDNKKILSPNQQNTVFELIEDDENSEHFLYYSFNKGPLLDRYFETSKYTDAYTISFFAKKNTKNKIAISAVFNNNEITSTDSKETFVDTVIFNLSNGTYDIITKYNNIAEVVEANMTLSDQGFYRCSIKVKNKDKKIRFKLNLVNDLNQLKYQGDGDKSVYIWGAQFQPGDLTEYFQTDNVPGYTNRLNSFYYCSYDHNSENGVDTEPTDPLTPWRQDFFFEPDNNFQNTVNLSVAALNFKNSFSQRIKTKKNISTLSFVYKFSNITTKKAKAILHFLENKAGYRRFLLNMDSVYNKPKVFYAPSWNHTWNYQNSHDIEVQLIEDPLGIIPEDQ